MLSASISLIIRENTGNSLDFDHLGVDLHPEKVVSSLGFLLKFPTQPNRELFTRNREFNLLIREFSSENREAIRVDILPDDETYKRGTLGYNDPAGCSRDRGVFAII